jgi:para-nitrobenzyl esterase
MIVATVLFISSAYCAAKQPSPVKIESGLLQGTSEDGVMVYRGIPFAAPPVGELRWSAPRPPAPWTGVRVADTFSANPTQLMRKEYGPWTAEYQPQGTASEDCLYLNIWTASNPPTKTRPVMVYIPGGAFTGGSGNVPVYNGEHLAQKGVVVVTINYRVGVMGFFAHPELTKESGHNSSGNYGLLDQVAALQWVKRNISAFGGDPTRVTIMGQSAGVSSVHFLTASPLAKGLFIRAIALSGSNARIGPGESLAMAEQNGIRFAQAKGASSLAALRAMTMEEVTAATDVEFRFSPIVDGWFLPQSVDEIVAAGGESDVATLTGWVADEGSFNNDYGKLSAEAYRQRVSQQMGSHAEEILKLYPASTDAECAESQRALARDVSMVSMYQWALLRGKTCTTSVYTYLFTHPQPGATKERYLTFHSSELPYVFDNLDQAPRPWTIEDEAIAKTLSQYWVNFIATGDPNGKGLPRWPAFGEAREETMRVGDSMGPRPIAGREKFEALKTLFHESAH